MFNDGKWGEIRDNEREVTGETSESKKSTRWKKPRNMREIELYCGRICAQDNMDSYNCTRRNFRTNQLPIIRPILPPPPHPAPIVAKKAYLKRTSGPPNPTHLAKEMVTESQKALEYSPSSLSPGNVQEPSTKPG